MRGYPFSFPSPREIKRGASIKSRLFSPDNTEKVFFSLALTFFSLPQIRATFTPRFEISPMTDLRILALAKRGDSKLDYMRYIISASPRPVLFNRRLKLTRQAQKPPFKLQISKPTA